MKSQWIVYITNFINIKNQFHHIWSFYFLIYHDIFFFAQIYYNITSSEKNLTSLNFDLP
jgi:hypothetical protein